MRILRRRKERRPANRFAGPTAPEGLLVPTGLRRFRVYRVKEDDYQIWRGDRCDVGSYMGSLASVLEYCREREAQEDETAAAARTGVPIALCRVGWHRARRAEVWFRLANNGRRGGTLVYWVGRQPLQAHCRWIMTFDGVPWRCYVCDRDIHVETRRFVGP